MRAIDRNSLLKREAWIGKRLGYPRRWPRPLFQRDSDHQLLRRQENAQYSLILFLGFYLVETGIPDMVEAEKWIDSRFIFSVIVLGFVFYLGYSAFRLRWALEAFEQFAPQTLADLKSKIAEQAVAPNRSTLPSLNPTSSVRGSED